MKRMCAFLSMDSLEDFVCYDELLVAPLAARGWEVHTLSWRDRSRDWSRYESVIIRSTWDYQADPEAFLEVLHQIEASGARLANDLNTVQWNMDKRYLLDLERKGVEIVPMQVGDSLTADQLLSAFDLYQCEEIVIKPSISANANHTYRLDRSAAYQQMNAILTIYTNRSYLLQPFMPSVVREGEYSLFFFNHAYSHTILKRPKEQDFRVQEEHGGRLQRIHPSPQLLQAARKVQQSLPSSLLYSRVDLVRTAEDNFAVMEVELIEPSLYFPYDAASPDRFADAFVQWMKRENGKE